MQATSTATRATWILRAEHEIILTVLDCLEKVADNSTRAGALDRRSAHDILDFLGTLADRCHHGKEERCLFPALVKKGLPQDAGPVAVMLAEHEQGRAAIAGMRAAVVACGRKDSQAVERFNAHARAYVQLLREHIAKENNVLFPMADGMLTEAEQAALLREFGDVETSDLGAGTHEHYLLLAEDLVQRLGVIPSKPIAVVGSCCGHGGRCA
ncbi:MAG: hemerythrin [Planctomycetota bacterium]|nr:MAG: hemerythrin [Planctomycetota bacterium]